MKIIRSAEVEYKTGKTIFSKTVMVWLVLTNQSRLFMIESSKIASSSQIPLE